ncbi:MAG: sigma 54-interacting transcriptional regulator [Myxococcota bacterium]
MSTPQKLRVLVVDDEPDLANVITYNLTRHGHQASSAESGEAAETALQKEPLPDIVISDVMMPGIDGFELCRRLRANPRTADIPLFFLTARSAAADRYEGFRAGCDDYLAKPFDMQELMLRVDALARRLGKARKAASNLAAPTTSTGNVALPPAQATPTALMQKLAVYEERFPALRSVRRDVLLGSSESVLSLFEEILIQAHTRDPVLILGETGTGKTVVAEALWRLGPRSDQTFRTVNCAELQAADPLIVMGRLFGFGRNSGLQHVPKEGQPGILEECHGGTLFLDEVALLPSQAQALLLLPAEGRPFNLAAGRGDPVTVDVKLIFATNRDVHAEARAGRFPLDFVMRMGQSIIRLTPLRERPEDARELCIHFVEEAAREMGRGGLKPSLALLEEVARRPWPGNVRELRNSVRDAVRRAVFHDSPTVELNHLPPATQTWRGSTSTVPPVTPPSTPPPVEPERQSTPPSNPAGVEFTAPELAELAVLRKHRFQIGPSEAELGLSQKSRTLTNHLRGLCFKALHRTQFNVGQAALAVVGSSDEALHERMQARIHHYLVTVRENVTAGTPEKLFNNLPRDYHRAVEEAVSRARSGGLPDAPRGTQTSQDDDGAG